MLSTIILRYDIVVIISVIFIALFNYNYELRKFKTNHKRSSSVFSALKHRFLKREDNVTSVFYIFNKTAFLIRLIIFNIIRLNLACLGRDICFYINVFFYVHIFFSLSYLNHLSSYNLTLY